MADWRQDRQRRQWNDEYDLDHPAARPDADHRRVYYTQSSSAMDARNAIHKEIGGLIAETFL
jgi:hypothetical protein